MWDVVGHRPVLQFLEHSLGRGRLAHSYLLVGPPHVGKLTIALQVAQAANCEGDNPPCQACTQCARVAAGRHADVVTIGVDEGGTTVKEIGIDRVRELQRIMSLSPFEGRCHVFIIDGAERLSEEASNALLKTLEEPPDQVLLVALATSEDRLLPTIRSRCQRLELLPMSASELASALEDRGVPPERARSLAAWSQGCPGLALLAMEDGSRLEMESQDLEQMVDTLGSPLPDRLDLAAGLAERFSSDREGVAERLEQWVGWWRDLLLVGTGAAEYVVHPDLLPTLEPLGDQLEVHTITRAIRMIQETQDHLGENANPRLALEHLLLSLPEVHPPSGTVEGSGAVEQLNLSE